MKCVCLFLLILPFAGAAWANNTSPQPLGKIGALLDIESVRAGDWIQLFVCRGERVEAGQRLAVQRNGSGRVVQEYIAGSSGRATVAGRVGLGAIDTTVEIGTVSTGDSCAGRDCSMADKD
ncbi:hypothetical protein [Microbulbifer taiwanensis]|uniref:DUF5666 domain-containing protein n=1 Tax=Microbulbifer taiwanensis TaxID=986746 RepID=A0ABW1YMX2_9GAMM|nr:hypothetical protein [Microbulbifer taiwanensis]